MAHVHEFMFEPLIIEEIRIEEDPKKKGWKKKNMEKSAPLIFEECYIKSKGLSKVQNSFDLVNSEICDPTHIVRFRGVHLFVMCHGF